MYTGRQFKNEAGNKVSRQIECSRAQQRVKDERKCTNVPIKKSTIQTFSIVQFNKIIKHEYRELENPAYTVANYLHRITKLDNDQIFKDFKHRVPQSQKLDRPDRVIAYIEKRTGAKKRSSIITQIGHLGNFEGELRGRTLKDYDGGHLLALRFFKDWPKINTPSNVAPQRRDDNQARGNWNKAEVEIDNMKKIVIEAAVNYPDRTYTIWPSRAMEVIKVGSATAIEYNKLSLWDKMYLPQLVHTWVPSQYHMSVTSIGELSSPVSKNILLCDFTNWFPIIHRVISPIKGLLTRIIPYVNLFEIFNTKYYRSIDVRSQGNHPLGDILNEVKQMVIDLTKLTTLVFGAKQIAYIGNICSKIPGITTFAARLPLVLSSCLSNSPIAALLIYAFAHQMNIVRIIPEYPRAKQLKYFLEFLGL